MATPKTATKYLLMLDAPVCAIPVGLYDSPEEALAAAVDFGLPPDVTGIPLASDLGDRVENSSYCFDDMGVQENRRPNGYTVLKFVGDTVVGYSTIEPYEARGIALPGDPGPTTIDPDQELIF